jgi:hypothetical protein
MFLGVMLSLKVRRRSEHRPAVPDEVGRIFIRGLRAFGTRWDIEAIGTNGHVRLAR